MLDKLKTFLTSAKVKATNFDWTKGMMSFFEKCRWFNIKLTTAFDITTTIHWSVLVFLAYLAMTSPTTAFIVSIALLSVVPHEYGHALVARCFGVKTRQISIYPIGGIALLEAVVIEQDGTVTMKLTKWKEFLVTAAGPLVSFSLAAISFVFFYFEKLPVYYTQAEENLFVATPPHSFWFYMAVINLGLFLFNLVPAFPMDGGRMLRSILSLFLDYLKATKIAFYVSMFFIFLLTGLAFWTGNMGLAVTMFFIMLMSRMEVRGVQSLYDAMAEVEKAKAESEAKKEAKGVESITL